jgi:hypothetical protein
MIEPPEFEPPPDWLLPLPEDELLPDWLFELALAELPEFPADWLFEDELPESPPVVPLLVVRLLEFPVLLAVRVLDVPLFFTDKSWPAPPQPNMASEKNARAVPTIFDLLPFIECSCALAGKERQAQPQGLQKAHVIYAQAITRMSCNSPANPSVTVRVKVQVVL